MLLQRDCATCYDGKFVMFHEVWEIETFQKAKLIYKVIGNGAIQ